MRALTIHQPWADAIVYGTKRVENRTWRPPEAALGCTLLIHAGKRYDPMGRFVITDWDTLDNWPDERGAVIGIARLAGCHLDTAGCCAPWGERGVYHWQLADIRSLRRPIPYPGRQRLWTPDADLIRAITTTHTR